MKLDGKRLAMNLISSSDMEVDEELSKEIESDDYKISVKGKKIKGEEALLFEGTLTIEKPDGTVVNYLFTENVDVKILKTIKKNASE
jgi:hypothetical protein